MSKPVTEVVNGLRRDGVAFLELGDRHSSPSLIKGVRFWVCSRREEVS